MNYGESRAREREKDGKIMENTSCHGMANFLCGKYVLINFDRERTNHFTFRLLELKSFPGKNRSKFTCWDELCSYFAEK
jgi:hypothetical protein